MSVSRLRHMVILAGFPLIRTRTLLVIKTEKKRYLRSDHHLSYSEEFNNCQSQNDFFQFQQRSTVEAVILQNFLAESYNTAIIPQKIYT